MAQNPPAPVLKLSAPREEEIPNVGQDVSPDSVVSTSVLTTLPAILPEATFSEVAGGSTAATLPATMATPPAEVGQHSDSPGGETKWVILAAIVTAAAVIAAILLFPHRGKKPQAQQGPVGTVIAAGTPTVATPNH
jgi:hypothetical protein